MIRRQPAVPSSAAERDRARRRCPTGLTTVDLLLGGNNAGRARGDPVTWEGSPCPSVAPHHDYAVLAPRDAVKACVTAAAVVRRRTAEHSSLPTLGDLGAGLLIDPLRSVRAVHAKVPVAAKRE